MITKIPHHIEGSSELTLTMCDNFARLDDNEQTQLTYIASCPEVMSTKLCNCDAERSPKCWADAGLDRGFVGLCIVNGKCEISGIFWVFTDGMSLAREVNK